MDKVTGKTTRFASKHLVYSPHLRSHLFTSEGDEIQAYPLRRFFNGIRVARFIGQGTLTALATSRWHPCLLVGTSGGLVSCTNILRRVLPSIKRPGGSGAWVQKLCEYHWIPETSPPSPVTQRQSSETANANLDSASGDANASDPVTHNNNDSNGNSSSKINPPPSSPSSSFSFFHGPDTRPGTSRFHDGFKAEKQDLSLAGKTKARGGTSAAAVEGRTSKSKSTSSSSFTKGTEMIFEEEQAVTVVEWNPNLGCAGWMAVGWGSGIVRVEDVGHEAV
jgi:hypothetical protein